MTSTGNQTEHDTTSETDVKEPKLYSVILLNDDVTTMDFVVDILKTIFKKSIEQAVAIMFHVHVNGEGEAGRYSYDIANTKATQTMSLAKKNGFPLKAILREVKD